jgi:hypothetical protein
MKRIFAKLFDKENTRKLVVRHSGVCSSISSRIKVVVT